MATALDFQALLRAERAKLVGAKKADFPFAPRPEPLSNLNSFKCDLIDSVYYVPDWMTEGK